MEMKFCQSCGMPLTNEILGKNFIATFESGNTPLSVKQV